ncbi:murein biosynthesis integral membrane protein MurJ [Clavibacter sp. VKM Ac-2873]|uniref:murein biosynthesis integral membrane protein MurJ n=1 Tax=Clavibacter sp. VKM Ac-2873 TaxID=2783813 RepID=UPI00188DA794|nr:murein biosynthesis integral membrane protein MurJ [Clavibacter sp. VKM Ac-2873]MBF4617948.1 murein biosynthesis integral membrane protein MurJ [Clavibacter sp. VKM Ac-2873]
MTGTPAPRGGGIGRASALLASGTFVSRILGFVKAIVLLQTIGATLGSSNAFSNANQLPNNIYVIIAGGVLNAVLVPQVVRAAKHADGGAGYINKLVTIAIVVLGGVTILATVGAPVVSRLYAATLPPDVFALVVAFAYWCLPQILFYGLYAVLGEVLNARGSFGPFTWAPVLNNVVAIAGLLVFQAMFGSGSRPVDDWSIDKIVVLAGSATLGVVAQALILFVFWRRVGLRFRFDFAWRGVGLGTAGRLAGWTFGMLVVTQLAGIAQSNVANIAATSDSPSSTILLNAWLFFMLPHSIFAVSIATAYFTRMSTHAGEGDHDSMRADLSSAVRLVGLMTVLSTALIAVLAGPVARVMVSGDIGEVRGYGDVLIAFILGLPAFSTLFVLQRAFYALSDTRTPFLIQSAQVVLFIAGALVISQQPVERIGVGLAVLQTVTVTGQAVLAAVLLRRRIGRIDGRRILRSAVRFVVAAVPAALVGIALLALISGGAFEGVGVASKGQALLVGIPLAAVMTAVYLAALAAMRSSELQQLAGPVLRRIRRR